MGFYITDTYRILNVMVFFILWVWLFEFTIVLMIILDLNILSLVGFLCMASVFHCEGGVFFIKYKNITDDIKTFYMMHIQWHMYKIQQYLI